MQATLLMENITVFCFLASYALALALEGVRLLGRSTINRLVMIAFATAGLVAHTWYLWIRSQETHLPPLLASSHDWLLVLAWLAVVLYLVITLADRTLAAGVFLLPPVLLLIAAAYFVSDQPQALSTAGAEAARELSKRGWAMLHASLLVIGIAGVLIGFVLSMMYLVQHRLLRRQQTMGRGLTLPSLERLARLNWWAVILSVPLLTLGMLTGVVLGLYAGDETATFTFGDPVVLISGVAWLVMVVLFVWMLSTHRPAGRQVAWRTLWAFGFLLVTLIGLQVLTAGVLESPHA